MSVRVTDHRGNAETYRRHGEENGEHYGLVIKLKPNRFKEHTDVDYLEFVYFPDRLDASQQKDIVSGLSRFLQTGDYSLFAKANEVNGSGKFKNIAKNIATEDGSFRSGEGSLSDDALSEANDAVAKVLGETRRSRAQRKRFAERERSRMRKAAEQLAEKLHLDNIDIVDEGAQFGGRRAKAKGFYDKKSRRITIVVGNHASVSDVVATVLHEAVAHHGLRKLFGRHFDTFLDNVFEAADENVRRRIVELSKKHGWNVRTATEEYLASLAEETK